MIKCFRKIVSASLVYVHHFLHLRVNVLHWTVLSLCFVRRVRRCQTDCTFDRGRWRRMSWFTDLESIRCCFSEINLFHSSGFEEVELITKLIAGLTWKIGSILHFSNRFSLILFLQFVDITFVQNRFFFEFIKTYKFKFLESMSLELIKLKRMPQYLAQGMLSICQLPCLLYPFVYHLSICILFNLEPFMRFEFFMSYEVKNHKTETEDIWLECLVSNYLASLYFDELRSKKRYGTKNSSLL